jgi:TonB-dependent starch-binding outer membrane protein SusC
MKKFLLSSFVLLFALVSGDVLAQERTVSGRVTAAEDGTSLPGVNVLLKGTGTGTVTDVNGNYRVSVPASGGTLVFSFIGLLTQEVETGSRSTVDVIMESDVRQLSEVIVTGYGAQEKRSISGSISSVKGSVIENMPLQSFDRALQGRAAGVLVQSSTGIPGGAVNVRIRGTGSITAGNDPLYIVDGVQLNQRDDAGFTQSNPLAFLNPNDIESIEVLKDAATAAIYGAQAANGVVIITTKKGKSGKARFNLGYFTGTSESLRQLDVLNSQEWYTIRKEAWVNSGNAVPEANALNQMGRLPANWQTLTPAELDAIADALPTYDWQKEAFQTGKVNNIELSVSGGDDKTTFYMSGSYNYTDAIIPPTNFSRGTFKSTLTHKATSRLTIENQLNLSTFYQEAPFAVSGSFLGSPAFSSSTVLPHNAIYNEDGTFNKAIAGVLNQNVIAVVNENSGGNRTNQAVGNLSFNYKILDNLTFRSFWGLDYRLVQGENYRDPRTPDGAGVQGRGSIQSNWNTNFISTQTVNYNTSINNVHNINVLGGFEYRSEVNEGLSGSAIGFPTFQFRTIQSAATPEAITGFWTGFRRMGGFAQVNYDYNKKYNLTLTGRYDGSSRFGVENRFGFFPSVAASWIIKEEAFLQNVDFLSDLKVRASFGRTGNDAIGNFASRGLYQGAGNYAGQAGIRPTGLANTLLGWETNQTINLGLDFAILNNRFQFTIDAFERRSKDLLLDQPILWTSGYSNLTANVGELLNRGLEFEVRTVNVDAGGFKWTSDFNITFIENEVVSLYDGLEELPGDPSVRVGESLGTWYAARFAGVNPATGRPMWYDINDNLVYQHLAADRVVIGNSLPTVFGGFNNTFSYKRFELTVFFQYEYGRMVSDTQVSFLRENGTRLALNALRETAEARWQEPGDVTWIPRQINTGTEVRGSGRNSGDANLQNADYIRLKQATLAYNFNPELLRRIGVNQAKVYAMGVNLWTLTNYIGYDPEWTAGAASGIIPQSRNITFGVQLSF